MIIAASLFVGWVAGVWTSLILTPSRTPYDFNSLAEEFRAHAKQTEAERNAASAALRTYTKADYDAAPGLRNY